MRYKATLRSFFSFIILAAAISILSSCRSDSDSIGIITKNDGEYNCDYSIVYGKSCLQFAEELAGQIKIKYGISIECLAEASAEPAELEILAGADERVAYSELAARITKRYPTELYYSWGYSVCDGRLVLYYSHDTYAKEQLSELIGKLMKSKGFFVKKDAEVIKHKSIYEHEAEESARDEISSMGEMKERFYKAIENNNSLLNPELGTYLSAFGGNVTKSISTKANILYSTPPVLPDEGIHPRVNISTEEHEKIKELFATQASYELSELLFSMADKDFDGKFTTQNTADELTELISVIEAKAFMYLITGKSAYGFEAIVGIKNAILTIPSSSDAIGAYLITVAAQVYDWCYDIMTAKDKDQLVAGVEMLGHGMSIGFPPTKLSASHNDTSPEPMLCAYLAFSAAIYDECPDWWHFCAGRFYSDFVEYANNYLQKGIFASNSLLHENERIYSHLSVTRIISSLGGEAPYKHLDKAYKSLLSYALPNGRLFAKGNFAASQDISADIYYKICIMTSSLYGDTDALYYGKLYSNEYKSLDCSSPKTRWTPVLALIYLSCAPSEIADAPTLPLINYTPAPSAQIIVRNSWDDDCAAVLMGIGEIYDKEHESRDFGTFQIYYKGLLSCSGGISYDESEHQKYCTKNTVYSYKYKNDGESIKYAYLSAEYEKAYEPAAVSFAERKMLSIYTENPEFPLLLLVFDKAISENPSAVNKFLLQAEYEPTLIDQNSDSIAEAIISKDDGGALVLTSLSGAQKIEAIGGESNNFNINGQQLSPEHKEAKSDSRNMWGRVEISASGEKSTAMLTLMYVKDSKSDDYLSTRLIETDMLTGVQIDENIAVFVNDSSHYASVLEFEATGNGDINYYISGVKSGAWTISVNGVNYSTAVCPSGKDIITFTAPAGRITLTPSLL